MPLYRILVVNKSFSSASDGDFATLDEARRDAMKGALQIGSDEICDGVPFFAAEIRIEVDRKLVERMIVSIGHSPLEA